MDIGRSHDRPSHLKPHHLIRILKRGFSMVFPNSIKPRQKQIKQRKQIQKPKQASKQTNQSKRQDPKANHQREKTMEIPGTSSEQEKVEFSADNIQRTKGGHFGTQLPSFFETSNVWIQTTFQFTRE